eukprot:5674597-Pyramimonas_sp.AAC.1
MEDGLHVGEVVPSPLLLDDPVERPVEALRLVRLPEALGLGAGHVDLRELPRGPLEPERLLGV